MPEFTCRGQVPLISTSEDKNLLATKKMAGNAKNYSPGQWIETQSGYPGATPVHAGSLRDLWRFSGAPGPCWRLVAPAQVRTPNAAGAGGVGTPGPALVATRHAAVLGQPGLPESPFSHLESGCDDIFHHHEATSDIGSTVVYQQEKKKQLLPRNSEEPRVVTDILISAVRENGR